MRTFFINGIFILILSNLDSRSVDKVEKVLSAGSKVKVWPYKYLLDIPYHAPA